MVLINYFFSKVDFVNVFWQKRKEPIDWKSIIPRIGNNESISESCNFALIFQLNKAMKVFSMHFCISFGLNSKARRALEIIQIICFAYRAYYCGYQCLRIELFLAWSSEEKKEKNSIKCRQLTNWSQPGKYVCPVSAVW